MATPVYPPGSYPRHVVDDGATHYWRLGELSGTTAVDSIGGANGTISGGVTLNQPGALSDGDKAMLFDAANDYISVPVGPYSAIGTGSFSIELWVNSVQTFVSAPFIIDNSGGANGAGFAVFRTAFNRIGLKIANGTTNAITTSVCTFDGRWHHVVAVLRRGTPDVVEVFVDGISGGTGSPAADGWNLTSTRALLFSTYSGGEADADFRYNGSLDDVAIYPVALTAAQIAAHYAARLWVPPPAPPILFYLNGVPATSRVRWPAVTLQDVLGAQPNTGTLTFDTVAPGVGDAITIGLGTLDPPDLLFGGEIQNLEATYQADARNPGLREWPVDLIDHSFALNKRRPFVSFVNESATTAAQYLVAIYAPGFTVAHVQAGLPTLTINFDGSQTLLECLNAIAQAIGGRTKVDYSRDVHLFLPPEPGLVMPDPITLANPPLNSPPIRFTVDLSQCRTRVYGKGHGETIPSDIAIGETILPVASITFFNAAGGRAIASLTSDGAQTQQLTYTGVQVGGVGTVVGPGAAPSAKPTLAPIQGAGLSSGAYSYASTWVTAVGETLPSPVGTCTTGSLANPTINPTVNAPISGPGPDPGLHYWGYSFVSGAGAQTLVLTSTNSQTTSQVNGPSSMGIDPSHTYGQSPDFAGRTMRCAVTIVTPSGVESGIGIYIDVTMPGVVGGTSNGPQVNTTALPAGATGYRAYASRDGGATWHWCALYAGSTAASAGNVTPYFGASLAAFDAASPPPSTGSGNVVLRTVPLTAIPLGPPGTTARQIYRTPANAAYADANFKIVASINDNTTTAWNDTVLDSALTGALPASNTTAINQVNLSAIAVGPTAVTARKIYRSAVNTVPLKLLATIANNTATTYGPDTASDASLGALAPTIDTSQLTQPTGQVVPGSTSIPTAGASPFLATGGWVQSGPQVIRYTGVTANALTGVPATGPGSITSSLQYNAPIVAVPALIGVAGITRSLQNGSAVHLFVQRDDTTAQAALGELERNPDGSPTDGVREYLISDERRGETSLIAACAADLADFAQPIVQVVYHCRDPKTRAGSTVNVAIADGAFNPDVFNPAVFNTGHNLFGYAGEFLIQSVTVTFDPAPQLLPRYAVTASSSKFTFMDLLQRVLITS